MSIKLEDCKLISNLEYMDLLDPRFECQTRVNNEGEYYMVFSDNGVLYKTLNKL